MGIGHIAAPKRSNALGPPHEHRQRGEPDEQNSQHEEHVGETHDDALLPHQQIGRFNTIAGASAPKSPKRAVS